jgi:predicted flap endonuclease-1-like 5' DNA nuclease
MMEKRNSLLTNPLLVFAITVLVSFLLAFVVITRWLWPVEWSDAAPQNLTPEGQVQWLRLAINDYAVNQDASLAAQRYSELGSDAPEVLAAIQLDPDYQDPADIAAFTDAIDAEEIPPAPTYPVQTSWKVIGWIFALLFLAILAYLIYEYWRSRQAEKAADAAAQGASYGVEEPELERPPWESEFPEAELPPAEEQAQVWPEETFVQPESEEPEADELPEEDEGILGDAAMAAGALAAGAVVAGALSEETDEEEAEVEDESAAAEEETFDDDLPDWLANLDMEEDTTATEGAGWVAAGAGVVAGTGADADELPDWLADLEPGEEEIPAESGEAVPLEVSLSPEEMPKFHNPIDMVEGIGPVYAAQLMEAGINTPLELLQMGATPAGRKRIADETGLSHKLILRWVNQVDLYRIKGIGEEYADLLEAAGVDTVVELAQRVPENLHTKLAETNAEKNLVRQLPTEAMVADWVAQAKSLPRYLKY